MIEWRWDQGRVVYFQVDVMREIAKVLVVFDNQDINDPAVNDVLAATLRERVGLPFAAPEDYKINRNYGRVFQCGLLARYDGHRLQVSDICRLLAVETSLLSDGDSYLLEVMRRFRYPFPAFEDYDAQQQRVYPFCAVLKYLISLLSMGQEPKARLSDICRFVIGNGCTGLEPLETYQHLSPTDYVPSKTELRQLREMMSFISQLSFLTIFDGYLYLDVADEAEAWQILQSGVVPLPVAPQTDRTAEFRQLGRWSDQLAILPQSTQKSQWQPDAQIAEGRRVMVQHFRIERSPLLRKFYKAAHPDPICEACGLHVQQKYPWVGYMLDIHHLLPLASAMQQGTTLSDIVGLCPSCHRAIHSYYRRWLKANSQKDFNDRQEAMAVYLEAVKEVRR